MNAALISVFGAAFLGIIGWAAHRLVAQLDSIGVNVATITNTTTAMTLRLEQLERMHNFPPTPHAHRRHDDP